jgi:hypothetical protein
VKKLEKHYLNLLKLLITFTLIFFYSYSPVYSVDLDPASRVYKTGTVFLLKASSLGLSAEGTMEILESTSFRGEDVILVRSRVTKMGGLMGFIVKLLRIYKESNTFDSYISPHTFLAVRYEVYKLGDKGNKKLTEHVFFNREKRNILSLQNNEIIVSNVAPDTQDAFSIFLSILYKLNSETPFVGKSFEVNLYAYKKTHKVKIIVTNLILVDKDPVYTLEIKDLPAIFKYPASVEIKVTDIGGRFLFPVYGKCIIHVPVLPDITVEGRLSKVK